ncbi:MAG TPA: serine/threonine-protein kinase [Gemmatimonadales bacterium]|nr:serine/threonine-protein kinase [Gemmatimonadales bacterium]
MPEGRTHCPQCGPGSLALLGEPVAGTAAWAAEDATPPAADRLARALGPQYQVIRLIGRGGFAEVFEVTDTDLQRRLAVKVLRSDLPWGPGTLARFKQEARAIARLNHPNTVPIHFVGEGEGLVYYAMPYLEGRTLAELLRTEGPLPPERALGVVEPILEALQHAHDHGLVHRDVKPDNILLEARTGRPLLVDFGIVKYLDGPAHLTDSGFIVGTPLYMSPEQALGSRVDARTDVYGVGAVLFQLLTGAPPFEGNDSQEIVGRHLQEPVPVATLSRDGIPPWLSRIVVRCMAKHPDDRYPTARALLEALREGRTGLAAGTMAAPAALSGPAPRSLDEAPTEKLPAARRPWRRLPWVAAALVGLGAAGAASAFLPRPEAALVVQNRLTRAIALTLEDTALRLAPGDSARVRVARGRPVEAHWAMVQPTSPQGRPLGGPVEGTILVERAGGEMRREVYAGEAGEGWLAPIVTNLAGRPLGAVVVADGDTIDCRCLVRPGETMHLGYYRAAGGTAVLVSDAAGWTARLGALEAERDSVTGAVALRVDSATLRPPRRPAPPSSRGPQRRSSTATPNPLSTFLPVH